jgi:uncharacterized protein (DUF1778 family)
VSVAKLSVSMDASLVKLIRRAAAEEGVSLSTWLAEAASQRARQRALREAVAEQARGRGTMTAEEASRLVEAARASSRVSRPRRKRA